MNYRKRLRSNNCFKTTKKFRYKAKLSEEGRKVICLLNCRWIDRIIRYILSSRVEIIWKEKIRVNLNGLYLEYLKNDNDRQSWLSCLNNSEQHHADLM